MPGALKSRTNAVPSIEPWRARRPGPTAAILVLPGGGYGTLAPHEGAPFAAWLQSHGITAFVLRYRLGSEGYHHPCMLYDAARALRMVRANADRWNLRTNCIGVMGSSAGGHLAATLLTAFDDGRADALDPVERVSSRPDFGVLCYPVISLEPDIAHAGTVQNLLGRNPSPELLREWSAHRRVTECTPPVFLWSLDRDPTVSVEHSLRMASALRAAGVPFELHVYPGTRHGTGLRNDPDDGRLHPWTDALLRWLSTIGALDR